MYENLIKTYSFKTQYNYFEFAYTRCRYLDLKQGLAVYNTIIK
eukprot:UN17922